MRRSRLAAVLAFGITACVAIAAPDGPHGEKLRLTASDDAVAHAVTLQSSDFVPSAYGSVWRHVRGRPVVSALPQCPADADMSRFVISGIAQARWLGGNLDLDSQAAIFEKPWMLSGEWYMRTHALGCIRRAFAKALARVGDRLISFRTISLPRIAPNSIGLRMLVTLGRLHIPERWLADIIVVGRRRTAIAVTSSGFASDERLIFEAALGSARLLIQRSRA